MTALRRIIVNTLLAFLVCGSLYDIARDSEHWPFSQYPMFSGIWRATTFRWYRLVGVRDDGVEMVLDRSRYIRPFDQSRLHLAFVQLAERADATLAVPAAVGNALERYERQRLRGMHDGPHLRAMRLYLFEWHLEPDAGNVNRPDGRQLVAEARSRS
ncbi:MAG TPA: hypothetical protein VNG89_03980 [Vicinamibacterales bacterium]|nr:hypothetical protein [Vicinamibacterales bacterium]